MENKKVGWLIIGIGLAVGIIVWIFNRGLKTIVGETLFRFWSALRPSKMLLVTVELSCRTNCAVVSDLGYTASSNLDMASKGRHT